ncbi:meteorin-like protein [Oncorhynchus keta]|uniref:meteorin-like protein n=1 Tax=Oncorhynchus keta TaxID=8018 RepID=UPI00227B6F56|nr:meteorin-like protein [Oncorhynchus keta]
MLWPGLAHWVAAVFLCRVASAQYTSDQCSWRGSGLTHESHSRDVEQVYLRCSQGSLEWLYPTGALIVNLRPNTEPTSGASPGLHACIKPQTDSLRTAQIFHSAWQGAVFLPDRGALFIEAVGQQDISKRITVFQYELVASHGPGAHLYPHLNTGTGPVHPV